MVVEWYWNWLSSSPHFEFPSTAEREGDEDVVPEGHFQPGRDVASDRPRLGRGTETVVMVAGQMIVRPAPGRVLARPSPWVA